MTQLVPAAGSVSASAVAQLPPPAEQQQFDVTTTGEEREGGGSTMPTTIDHLEKELSLLAALPRQVRCRRILPETAFNMLENLIRRFLHEADNVVAGAAFTKKNNQDEDDENQSSKKSNTSRGGSSNSTKKKQAVAQKERQKQQQQQDSALPMSTAFLERADVWCDILDEFAETAEMYSTEVPLTTDQIAALNYTNKEDQQEEGSGSQLSQSQKQSKKGGGEEEHGIVFVNNESRGALAVESIGDFHGGENKSKQHQQNSLFHNNNNNNSPNNNNNNNKKKKKRVVAVPDSVGVNTAHSSDRHDEVEHVAQNIDRYQREQQLEEEEEERRIARGGGRNSPLRQGNDNNNNNSPSNNNLIAPGGTASSRLRQLNNAAAAVASSPVGDSPRRAGGRPMSPPRHTETELYDFCRKSFFGLSQRTAKRRALMLKLQVKEKLRDAFVQGSMEISASIQAPKSFFAPPEVETALRDCRIMQTEASKFAALVVQLYGELEGQLQSEYNEAFDFVKRSVDSGLLSSVSDRSRRDRLNKLVGLITDVYLTLAFLDSAKSDATINVSRALMSLCGLESRRNNHDAALPLCTEASVKLSKLYSKEASTINEFRATASAEQQEQFRIQQQALQQRVNALNSSIGSAGGAVGGMSPFRFLCQIHESVGSGFPAPLEILTEQQKSSMGNVIRSLQKRLNTIVPLRVAAHFNRASELEHTGASTLECKAEYTMAMTAGTSARLPEFALMPQHPLLVRVSEALSSLVSQNIEKSRSARFANANNTARLGGAGTSHRAASASLPPLASNGPAAVLQAPDNMNAFSSSSSSSSHQQQQHQQQRRSLAPQPPSSFSSSSSVYLQGAAGRKNRQQAASSSARPQATFSRAQQSNNAFFNSNNNQRINNEHSNLPSEARMIGAKNVSLDELHNAKDSLVPHAWEAPKLEEDPNMQMLKKFGIVPDNMEALNQKKQRPISSVAHIDESFIQDTNEILSGGGGSSGEQQQQSGSKDNNILGSSQNAGGGPSDFFSSQPNLSVSGGGMTSRKSTTGLNSNQQQQQQPAHQAAPLEKHLEEKLSSRQITILSGFHGMMEARGSKTHSRYESELDSIIIRCRRAFTERDRSARVIQCAWRCAVARLEAYNRRQVYYHFLYQAQKAAVAAILSTYRKHRQQQNFVSKANDLYSRREAAAKLEYRQRCAVITIARAIKKHMRQRVMEQELMRKLKIEERERLVRSDVAAVLVQRWWKIVKYEVKYWRRRSREVAAGKVEAQLALRLHAAATTVQRVFRGHCGRFEAKVVKQRVTDERVRLRRSVNLATDTIRTLFLEYRARRTRIEMLQQQTSEKRDAAQKTIRTGWYEALERRKMKVVRARAREVSLAAKSLQCWWRRLLAQKELRYRRKVSQTIAMVRIQKEWKTLRAAWVIQCAWRMYRARRKLRSLKAGVGREKINATWLMQRAGRAYAVRQSLCTERALVHSLVGAAFKKARKTRHDFILTIQSFLYPRTSQKKVISIREAELAEQVVVWRTMRSERREEKRTIFFQSVGRGFLLRKQTMPVLQLQHRERQKLEFRSARTIQCAWKSGKSREELSEMKFVKKKQLAKQQLWIDVQQQLHIDRVTALAVGEQNLRQSVAKNQRATRKEIIQFYFFQLEQLLRGGEEQEQQQQEEKKQQVTSASSPNQQQQQERVLRMYDDSDEEEQDEFVRRILQQK